MSTPRLESREVTLICVDCGHRWTRPRHSHGRYPKRCPVCASKPGAPEQLAAARRALRLHQLGIRVRVVVRPDGPMVRAWLPWSPDPYLIACDEDLRAAVNELRELEQVAA